jgi:tRNA pseudouridine38-40 synthase
MVRNIVGTLLLVGRGEQPEDWPGELLRGRDRTVAGPTAPADGPGVPRPALSGRTWPARAR